MLLLLPWHLHLYNSVTPPWTIEYPLHLFHRHCLKIVKTCPPLIFRHCFSSNVIHLFRLSLIRPITILVVVILWFTCLHMYDFFQHYCPCTKTCVLRHHDIHPLIQPDYRHHISIVPESLPPSAITCCPESLSCIHLSPPSTLYWHLCHPPYPSSHNIALNHTCFDPLDWDAYGCIHKPPSPPPQISDVSISSLSYASVSIFPSLHIRHPCYTTNIIS